MSLDSDALLIDKALIDEGRYAGKHCIQTALSRVPDPVGDIRIENKVSSACVVGIVDRRTARVGVSVPV